MVERAWEQVSDLVTHRPPIFATIEVRYRQTHLSPVKSRTKSIPTKDCDFIQGLGMLIKAKAMKPLEMPQEACKEKKKSFM